ncbi:hypothetical protein [Pseudomonas sp. TMW22080]|uniref:hypothetical protein n=1 Tax=Pseudomonas sp. TMW22080 TaxID=2506432 RepID=UPI001F0FCFDA|nr:hypothetical protein [Pseudomonas sp. TMW22080]MCH4882192.1 hypothetical protein [Pseudomonas sp. TMW22080]
MDTKRSFAWTLTCLSRPVMAATIKNCAVLLPSPAKTVLHVWQHAAFKTVLNTSQMTLIPVKGLYQFFYIAKRNTSVRAY